jgi:tetratricopeptide (TPR) repeat protein
VKGLKMLQKNKTWDYINVLLLIVVIFLVYIRSVNHDFIYDDRLVIIRQDAPRTIGDVVQYFKERHYETIPIYRPVARSSLLIQKAIHGDTPPPFHIFNIIVMGLCAGLFYGILRQPKFNFPRLPALFSAALFGLHPVTSPCVYPATGRETILCNLFILLAVFAFLHSGKRWYITAIIAGILALLSKENALVLAGIFVLADVLKMTANPPGKSLRKWISRYSIILIIYVLYQIMRYSLFQGNEYGVSIFRHPFLTLSNPFYTIQTIIAPSKNFIYEPMTIKTWFSMPHMILTLSVVFVLVIRAIKNWRYVKMTTLFWIGWLLIINFPTANIVLQEVKFAERYLFLAIISIIAITMSLTLTFWKKSGSRRIMIISCSIVIVIFTSITLYRYKYYKNDYAFYTQWLKTSPDYFLPYNSMANLLFEMGEVEKSAENYKKVIKMNPSWPDAYLNLGIIKLQWKEYDEAGWLFSQYSKLKPNSAKAHYSMGVAFYYQGVTNMQRAETLKLQGKNNEANELYSLAGEKYNKAIQQYSMALSINPSNAEAHHNIGVIYHENGQLEKAIEHYQKALQIKPDKKSTLKNLKKINNSNNTG